MRTPLLLLYISLAAAVAFGQVSFSGLDLSTSDRLLFSATTQAPDIGSFDTLFLADVRAKRMRQLTFFPENIQLIQDGDALQIQNRFGVFRSAQGFGGIAPLDMVPSFVKGSQIQVGKIAPMQTSPDGKYLLFLRARSAARGDLTLLDVGTGIETLISDKVELSLQELPAVWSPDSRFIIYAKAASLYYYSLAQLMEKRILAEALRKMGDGRIASIRWSRDRSLYYISGVIVYEINPSELFTRALYAGFLKIGKIDGKIPFEFDPNFDSFWVSPDGKNLLLNKGGRNIFLYYLTLGDFHASGNPLTLPYLFLPRDTMVRKVLWSVGNIVTLLCETRDAGMRGTAVYRLMQDAQGVYGSFQQTADKDIRDIVLSPDGNLAALMGTDGVSWKNYASWQDRGKMAHPRPLHVLWLGNGELLVAGAAYTERYSLDTASATLLALSQPGEFGHSAEDIASSVGTLAPPVGTPASPGSAPASPGSTPASPGSAPASPGGTIASPGGTPARVLTKLKDKVLFFDESAGEWKRAGLYAVRDKSSVSSNYRVYLEGSVRGSYASLVMVREAKGFGTTPLFPPESTVYEPFPRDSERVDFRNFTHGAQLRRREVSLVFNAIDSAEGLMPILNTLSTYRIRATFFINGEFIRRYPDLVKEIADSGHEVGSLFYAYFNMTDSRFAVDRTFVKGGLARNEDDYFAATGRELSLLWHAPYYIVNSEIIAGGADMNYAYVGRDVDSYDWVSASESLDGRGIYLPAADIVEHIVAEKKPGSIIPLRLGVGEARRDDYLFQRLDLVINELARRGYEIVPVSSLIEHAR